MYLVFYYPFHFLLFVRGKNVNRPLALSRSRFLFIYLSFAFCLPDEHSVPFVCKLEGLLHLRLSFKPILRLWRWSVSSRYYWYSLEAREGVDTLPVLHHSQVRYGACKAVEEC